MCFSFKSRVLKCSLLFLSSLLFFVLENKIGPLSAQATEIWSINEWRLRLPEEQNNWGVYLPKQFKVQTETQFSESGYQQFLLRTGPIWTVNSWLDFAAYASAVNTVGFQDFYKEMRWEIEPLFKGQMGQWDWSNRNRLVYRVLHNDTGWRYRNQTKFVYPLKDSSWHIFLSDELFISPQYGLEQNRWVMGVGQQFNASYAWSLAWQNRFFNRGADWLFENGLIFALTMF